MKTQIISLMDSVEGTSTNLEGFKLYMILLKAINDNVKVQLSLANCTPMASSFLNSAFGELIEKVGMDTFKQHVTLINFKPSQADQIKNYLTSLKLHC